MVKEVHIVPFGRPKDQRLHRCLTGELEREFPELRPPPQVWGSGFTSSPEVYAPLRDYCPLFIRRLPQSFRPIHYPPDINPHLKQHCACGYWCIYNHPPPPHYELADW